jgi:SAM-dependent methyltransferase
MNFETIKKIKKYLKNKLEVLKPKKNYVKYRNVILPPRNLRYCGEAFKEDSYFIQSGIEETQRLTGSLGLTHKSYLLDIGCGPGRLPIGILKAIGEINYQGVDVDQKSIDWCNKYISRLHPSFRFIWVNAKNDRYNPEGIEMDGNFRLPFNFNSFDIIYLHSVFTNMLEKDVRIYIKEFSRVLKPCGRLFLTAFIEENVPDITVNPDNYLRSCHGPLNIVRYEKNFFLSMFLDNGFNIQRFDHGLEFGGESGLYLAPIM